jgi:hypothetical protein
VSLSSEAVQVGMQRVLLPAESPFADMQGED